MNDFEKIEQLLLHKRFEELSPTELREVNSYFENAIDYNDMRDTLLQVKTTLAEDKLLIKPNVELKEKLLQQFDKTYTQVQPGSGGNVRPFYKNIKVQWAAAASVVLLVSLSIFGYIQDLKSKANDGMAVNYKSEKEENVAQPSAVNESTPGEIVTLEMDSTSVTDEETIGNSQAEDRSEKPVILGNISTTESELGEGSIENQPTMSRDNTTLDDRNSTLNSKEESKNDANYYFNDKLKNEDAILKSKDEEFKTNSTLPEKKENITNTTVNYNQGMNSTIQSKNKDRKKKIITQEKDQNGYNAPLVAEIDDTVKTAMDSLKLDSNINRKGVEVDIDQKKDND